MNAKQQTVLNAISQLNGQIIRSHVDIFELCDQSVIASKRRVGPVIDELITDGLVTGGKISVNGLTRFKYCC